MVKAKKKSSSSATTTTIQAEVAGVPLSGNKGGTKVKKRKRGPTEKKRKDMDVPYGVQGRIPRRRILPEGSRTLYATNLPCRVKTAHNLTLRVTTADIEEFFKEYGKIDVEFISLAAKIEFESHDVAKKALENKHGTFFICSHVLLDASLTPEPVQWNDDNLAERVIYVCGFGNTPGLFVLRTELKELFSSCREIRLVSTPQNRRTSLSLGYAFITFKDVESTSKALEKDGTKLMHHTLQVRRAKVEIDVKHF